MVVKAKFKCESVTTSEYNKQASLRAVCSSKGENADFAKATPFGELKINIDNEVTASDFFTPGKEYYLRFEEAN
jgi:hypothetical protein